MLDRRVTRCGNHFKFMLGEIICLAAVVTNTVSHCCLRSLGWESIVIDFLCVQCTVRTNDGLRGHLKSLNICQTGENCGLA